MQLKGREREQQLTRTSQRTRASPSNHSTSSLPCPPPHLTLHTLHTLTGERYCPHIAGTATLSRSSQSVRIRFTLAAQQRATRARRPRRADSCPASLAHHDPPSDPHKQPCQHAERDISPHGELRAGSHSRVPPGPCTDPGRLRSRAFSPAVRRRTHRLSAACPARTARRSFLFGIKRTRRRSRRGQEEDAEGRVRTEGTGYRGGHCQHDGEARQASAM